MNDTQLIPAQPGQTALIAGVPVSLSNLGPAELGQLLDIQLKWQKDQAEKALNVALVDFQGLAPSVFKGRKGDKSRYASLDDINEDIRVAREQCGLAITFSFRKEDGELIATCHVRHRDGAKFSADGMPVPMSSPTNRDGKAVMNGAQQSGSAGTYAKRYAINAALNLTFTEHDDDGHAAGGGASGPGAVDAKQGDHINDLLAKLPFDGKDERPILLNWAGVTSVYDIPASKYDKIVNRLNELIADL